jgi:site-specific recombinase XerC
LPGYWHLHPDCRTKLNIAELGKKHVREWKTLLTQYPLRATEVVELRNLTISEGVVANEQLKRPVLSDRTVNRYLSSLSAFLSWAVDNGYMDKQPVLGKRCIDPLRLHPLQIFLPPLPWRAINFPAIRRIRAFLKC